MLHSSGSLKSKLGTLPRKPKEGTQKEAKAPGNEECAGFLATQAVRSGLGIGRL